MRNSFAVVYPIVVLNRQKGESEDLRAVCQHLAGKREIDEPTYRSNFTEKFFGDYEIVNDGKKGQLKKIVEGELTDRYDFPRPLDLEDILYLIKEKVEEQYC